MAQYTMWIAEGACGGSRRFDGPPSMRELIATCDGLVRPVEVFVVQLQEIDRERVRTIHDAFGKK